MSAFITCAIIAGGLESRVHNVLNSGSKKNGHKNNNKNGNRNHKNKRNHDNNDNAKNTENWTP